MPHQTFIIKQCLLLRHWFSQQKNYMASSKLFRDSDTRNESSQTRLGQKSQSYETCPRFLSQTSDGMADASKERRRKSLIQLISTLLTDLIFQW